MSQSAIHEEEWHRRRSGGGGSEVNGVFRESKPGRSVGGVHRTRGIYARIKEATLAAS